MRTRPPVAVFALTSILLLLLPVPTRGWSYKEHIQFTRLAGTRLIADPTTPAEMKAWLEQCLPQRLDLAGEEQYFLKTRIGLEPQGYETGLLHWAYQPDVHAQKDPQTSKVEPFGAHERLMHFIDLEYFVAGDAKREYKPDLSNKPKADAIPRDRVDPRFLQAGYLPLRIEQVYGELVKSIRENRLQPTSVDDTNNAVYWAGYLAHYLADNTQPQHATIDYKSTSYFTNPRKAPNVHAAMEYLMCDDEKRDYPELRKEFWALFAKELESFHNPITTQDVFTGSVEVAMISYDALPLIGEAAAAATVPAQGRERTDKLDVEKFFRHRGKVNGQDTSVMEMKARQTAWAVKRIEQVWKQAWLEATKK